MAYTKTTWKNGQAPALNAANLNKIENGIADAHEKLDEIGTIKTANMTANKSIGTSGYTNLVSLALSPGKWLVQAIVRSSAAVSAACNIRANLATTSGYAAVQFGGYTAASQYAVFQETIPIEVDGTADVTYYLNAYCSSTQTMGTATLIKAIKIA